MSPQESTGPEPEQDEVDRIISGWAQALPELDTQPMAVLSRLTRLARYLDAARRQAFVQAGVEGWEFDMLAALRRSPDGALSPGALGAQTMVTSGTVTARVDKLVSRGLVRRERNPDDGRGVRVHLEADGIARVDDAITALVAAEATLLAPLDEAEQQTLAQQLRLLLLAFEHPPTG